MEQKAAFKTSLFGGYEKESVLKYIDDMSRAAAASEAKLQEQIEQITRSRRELEEQIAEFEKRMQDASETIDAEKGKNKKLSEMIGLLQEEIDRQRRQGESRTREYQAAQEKNRQLQEQVRQVEEKSKLYDEAAASIGSAILQAQQTAQSIVDEAGGQAKEIVDRANTQAQAITDDAQRFIDRVLQKMDDMQQEFLTLRGRMDESINQLNNRFAQLDEDIVHARELVTNIRERLTQQEEEQGGVGDVDRQCEQPVHSPDCPGIGAEGGGQAGIERCCHGNLQSEWIGTKTAPARRAGAVMALTDIRAGRHR